MFGRAGRGEVSARAHIFYSNRQAGKLKDPSLQCFVSLGRSENCRRREMLRLVGSTEMVASSEACCDVCSGGVPPSPRLDVLVPTPVTRPKKPKAVRFISPNMLATLKMALVQERNSIMEEFPGYKMIGGGFVLCDRTITELCALAPSVNSADDLNSVTLLRPEHKHRIFRVIFDIVSCAPSRSILHRI